MSGKRTMKESKSDSYDIIPFSDSRRVVEDFISLGKNAMKVYAIGDVDVTFPREKIKEYKRKEIDLSFTAFLTYCFVQTVFENPRMQAIRLGRKKMVVFKDVEVYFIAEREVKGVKVPTIVVIRKAQEKTILELTEIIRGTKNIQDDSMADKNEVQAGSSSALILKMPGKLRRWLFHYIFKNPFRRRKFFGTIGMTSIGMYAGGGGTSIPVAAHNLSINVGGIQIRPGYVMKEDGTYDTSKVVPREYLWMTLNIDHTTVDGSPAARFIAKLRGRIANGFGLEKIALKKE